MDAIARGRCCTGGVCMRDVRFDLALKWPLQRNTYSSTVSSQGRFKSCIHRGRLMCPWHILYTCSCKTEQMWIPHDLSLIHI
eukprot:14021077-Alexandrium_andersonii.AAC.1